MGNDEVRAALKRWGHATVMRLAILQEGRSTGETVLSRNRDLAPGTRENADRHLVGRDGTARRERMAYDPGAKDVKGQPRMRVVPMWACDPVPAHNDAGPPRDYEPTAVDVGVPDDLRWIDSAIASLSRTHPIRAMVLREEFTGTGTQRMKAARVERLYGGRMEVRQYRAELQRALLYLDARRAA